jgi:hypothetical protein
MPYKFRVGETVTVRQTRNLNVPGDVFEVVRQRPGTQGEPEYQIKSINEPHQRVARESELSKA